MATRDKVFAVLSDRIGVSALCAHGYLAVDLFFVLSGAVIAHAYEGRIFSRKLSVGSFVLTRIIRLWPLIALGTFIGACAETLRPGTDMSLHHVAHVAMAMFQSFVLLPDFSNSFMEDAIFPLNGPTWSLFFEIVANLAFIPVMLTRKSWVLAIILSVLSLALLVVSAVSVGGITEGPTHKGFTGGFARVFFSFSIGYLISILDFKLYVRNGRIIAPVLLAAIFIMPLMSQPLELLFNL
ncbi:MAG: acyltransferase family protein, partial [Janthinobacterium lividum]